MSLAASIVSGNLRTASVPFTHIWQSSLRLWEPIKKNRFMSQHLMTMLKMKLPKLKIPFLKHQHKVS